MKIYIASTFRLAPYLTNLAAKLETLGYEIPDVWWNKDEKRAEAAPNDAAWYARPMVPAIAERHWRTIKECDALVLVAFHDQETKFTGANVEYGYALALGKPVLTLGQIKRSAMYANAIRCTDEEELLACLAIVGMEAR
ncbi:MAG: nucleoside 2-deoxyribosyltransferase [Thermoplasmatota archaeon]